MVKQILLCGALAMWLGGCGEDAPAPAPPSPPSPISTPQNKGPAATDTTPTPAAGEPTKRELHELHAKALLEMIRSLTRRIAAITDAASARQALPDLKEAMAKMEELNKTIRALGAIANEDNALLRTPLGKELADAGNAFAAELKRALADPAIKVVLDELKAPDAK